MQKVEIVEKLNEIFSDVFDDDITVNDEMTADDIEDWDSFEQINLITAIEKSFNIKFKMETVLQMKNVGDMIAAIQEKTGK